MKKFYCTALLLTTFSLHPIHPTTALKGAAILVSTYACGHLTAAAYMYWANIEYKQEIDLLNSNLHEAWSDSLRTELIRIVLSKHEASGGWFFGPSNYPLMEYKEKLDEDLSKLSLLRIFCIGSDRATHMYQLRNWLSELRAYIIQDSTYMQECRHSSQASY